MTQLRQRRRHWIPASLFGVALVLLGAWLLRSPESAPAAPAPEASPKPAAVAFASAAEPPPDVEEPPVTLEPLAPEDDLILPAEPDVVARLFPEFDAAWSWARVDLDQLRDEFPENRFWDLAVPTEDPAVLEQRAERREAMNLELGRVLSNTATEAEVRAYYGERQRVSAEYVAVTSALLEQYGGILPERDVGMIELARTLHRARLEELPRRLTEALDRQAEHAVVREAWLADEAAFAAGSEPSGSEPGSR